MKKIFKRLVFFSIFIFQFLFAFSQVQDDFYNINKINDIRIFFKQSNWSDILDSLIQVGDGEQRIIADVVVNGKKYDNAGVRYKGFSSWHENGTKNPFNIALDYLIKNQNYQGYTKIKLGNVINDPSFVREVVSYEIVRKYMPASQANFANVYVNDTLIGLYTNVESVDDIFAEKFFGNGSNILIKGSPANLEYPFGQNANLAYTHGADSAGYIPYYKLESDCGWNELLKFIYILNNDTTKIKTILNVDRTLWMHAINYVLLNLDSYIGYSQNYYLYMDDYGQFNPIIWDLNMSFGSFRLTDGTMLNITIPKMKTLNPLQMLYYSTFSPRPLIKNIIKNPTFQRMFIAHMRTILKENIKNNFYYDRGLEIQGIIDQYVRSDSNKFYSYTDFINNIDTTTGNGSNQFPGIKDLMTARVTYLDNFHGFTGEPSISIIACSPQMPEKSEQISITARISDASDVILAYRYGTGCRFMSTTMFDDGNHNDGNAGDSIYGVEIIAEGKVIQYYIYAENDSAGLFSPERAEFEYYTIQPRINKGELVINEFCDQWIELFNNTKEDLNLKDIYLSDNPDNIFGWKFPDTVIKAKDYLVIWEEQYHDTKKLAADFSLSDQGDQLFLAYDKDHIIDKLVYNRSETSKTIGRFPNGVGGFVFMPSSIAKHNFIGSSNTITDFRIYPNPANNFIFIEVENVVYPFKIELFNINGQLLYANQFEYDENEIPLFSILIDISSFENGIYFTKVSSNEKAMTKKFIKF